MDEFPDALIVVTLDGRILSWSGGAERIFGYGRAECVGRLLDEVIVPTGREVETAAWREAARRDSVTIYETTRRRKDGSTVVVDATVRGLRGPSGAIDRLAISKKDVTRLKYLREAEVLDARYKGLLDAAPDAMVIVNKDGRIVLANHGTLRIFGYERHELVGEPIEVLVPPRFRAAHPGHRNQYFAEPRPRPMGASLDLAGLRKDGTEFPAEISLSPLRADDGSLLVAAAIRDVTERKRHEQRKAEELEEQHRRIQEASRMKSEFLANMSHELRTPLNAIIGFAKLMHGGTVGPVSDDHREYLGDILASAGHLLQLINDVLDLSKVEAGKMEFSHELVDTATLVRAVRETLRTIAAQKQIRLETEIDPAVASVTGDPSRLKQILYNYLSNAIKFTPEGGQVRIRVKPEGDERFRLSVEDTGVGIAERDLGRLFVEFQQLDASAAKKHQGTGLGLALTRRLVTAQGGSVGVESTVGRGSIFHAVLPRAGAPTTVERPAARRGAPGTATVLVVEDDARDREWLVGMLRAAGYEVATARTGREAVELCRAGPFAAITLDVLLPDMLGWDVLQHIRVSAPNRETPVIVTTVAGEASAGFPVHDYLQKPLRAEDLVASLARAGVKASSRVLVLDDEPANLRLASIALQSAGYAPFCRSDADEALRDVAAEPVSAVVLDLLMPRTDGFEFLARYRKTPAGREAPVIVWTAKDLTDADRVRLRSAAQAVLAKSGDVGGLLRELEALVPAGEEKGR